MADRRRGVKSRDSEVDGVYAWIVALTSFTAHVIIYGVIWSSGVFYDLFREIFQATSSMTSLVAILSTACTFGFGPVSSLLINRYGQRAAVIVGGLISGSGLVLSAYSQNMYQLAATFGVITGIGFGISYLGIITIVAIYFERWRTVALGLAVSGVGMGTFIFPPLIRLLVNTLGHRGSLLVIGGLTFNLCVCGVIMRPPRTSSRQKSPDVLLEDKEESTQKDKDRWKSFLAVLHLHIFKNPAYLVLCANNFLFIFGVCIVYVHIVAYAETSGAYDVSADKAALLVSVLGISNCAGRVLFGVAANLPWCSTLFLYAGAFTISGIVVLLVPVVRDLAAMFVLMALFGLTTGSVGPLLPQLITEFIGVDLVSSGYGYILIFEGVGSVLGPPVAGWLYDASNLYQASFYLGGSVLTLSGLIMFIAHSFRKSNTAFRIHQTGRDIQNEAELETVIDIKQCNDDST